MVAPEVGACPLRNGSTPPNYCRQEDEGGGGVMAHTESKLTQVLSGGLGQFWLSADGPAPDLGSEEPLLGSLRLVGDSVELRVFRDLDPGNWGRPPAVPKGIVGFTDVTGAVLLEVVSAGRSMSSGGGRIAFDRYTANSLVTTPDVVPTADLRLDGIALEFGGDGVLRWADLTAVDRRIKTDSRNRIRQVDLSFRSVPDRSVGIGRSRTLGVSAYWHAREEPDMGHLIDTALRITISTTRRLPIWEIAEPMLRVQELLGLAFGGYFPTSSTRARLAGRTTWESYWSSRFPTAPPKGGLAPADRRSYPVFSMAEVGGMTGLGRWVRLGEDHPRAMDPATRYLRGGLPSPEGQLLDIAAGIEYWVAVHARSAAWPKRGRNQVEALALHMGPGFRSWIGDPVKWSRGFWECYRGLKHQPSFTYTAFQLAVHAGVARHLLQASLLSRAAGTRAPARALFTHHRYQGLRDRARDLLGP